MTHIVFDWDGTLAKKELVEEANNRRCKTLDITIPLDKLRELQKTHAHYEINKQAIQKYTGITDEKQQTIIMTTLFQLHYLGTANEWKQNIFYPEILNVLNQLKAKGVKMSIATTLRADIIEPLLQNLKLRDLFGKIYGNTPDLAHTKEQLVKKALTECGQIHYMIGDREEDLNAGKSANAKTAHATWGHGELKDKTLADTILKTPKDILKLLK